MASAPQRTFADQVALRLAKADLMGNAQQMLGNIDMDTIIQPLDESLD